MSIEHLVLLGVEGNLTELTDEIAIQVEDLVDSTDDFYYAADEESGARDDDSFVVGQILFCFDPEDDFEEKAIPLKNFTEDNPRFKNIRQIADKIQKPLKVISLVNVYDEDDLEEEDDD